VQHIQQAHKMCDSITKIFVCDVCQLGNARNGTVIHQATVADILSLRHIYDYTVHWRDSA